MPRDFVPCLYTERELEDVVSQTCSKRCEVVEAFAFTDTRARRADCLLSLESHAYCLDTTPGDDRAREDLFAYFYAAMAALE